MPGLMGDPNREARRDHPPQSTRWHSPLGTRKNKTEVLLKKGTHDPISPGVRGSVAQTKLGFQKHFL